MPITPAMSTELKALHDHLMAEKPDGAVHDEASCPLCAMEALETGASPAGNPEGGSMTTFTQEQVDAAVAEAITKATAPLEAKVAELESASKESEVGKAVAEAIEPLNTQIADLQAKLDSEVAARTTAEQAKADLEAWWETAIAEKLEADAIAERKDERLTKLKEAAPETAHAYFDEHADRFAAMSDEDFEARLEEYSKVAAKAEGETFIPKATSLQASREGGAGNNNNGSMLAELGTLRRSLTDPRTL